MEEDVTPVKVETIPLLSPTMESELLREPWVFPHTKPSALKGEDSAAFLGWEENFQDLSGWCMDTFQGQCDFRIGESSTFKLSGTKYEGNGVLSSEEGGLKELTNVTDEEKRTIKMNNAGPTEPANEMNVRTVTEEQPASSRHGTGEARVEASEGSTSVWFSREASANGTTGSAWSKQPGTNVSAPFRSRYEIGDVHLEDDACPTPFDTTTGAEGQREPWDVLRAVETTGSDSFDLLSYLCDDELRSPEGSLSTDSSTVSRSRPDKSSSSPLVRVKEERDEPGQRVRENRTTSTITTSSSTGKVTSSRRSERTRSTHVTASAGKAEKASGKLKREQRPVIGKKRYADSDSDDRMSSHYRESREKNNEASRKSRMNKKAKETEMAMRAIELERDNRILKMKVEELEKLVTSMRSALLRSALKKDF